MQSNREVHYRYAVAALTLTVCVAIGFGLADDELLVDKISFSLTVTSLVLGFVAIIFTFMASNKQDAQLVKLLETNSSISSASTEITVAAAEISNHFRELPARFDHLDRQLEAMSKASLNTAVDEIREEVSVPEQPSSSVKPMLDFSTYFLALRYAGMASIYLYYKALQANKQITRELLQAAPIPDLLFHIGNIQAAEAAGFLEAKFTSNAIAPISMSEQAERELAIVVSKLKEGFAPDNALVKMLNAVDQMLP